VVQPTSPKVAHRGDASLERNARRVRGAVSDDFRGDFVVQHVPDVGVRLRGAQHQVDMGVDEARHQRAARQI
jgi:hypothetical protein